MASIVYWDDLNRTERECRVCHRYLGKVDYTLCGKCLAKDIQKEDRPVVFLEGNGKGIYTCRKCFTRTSDPFGHSCESHTG